MFVDTKGPRPTVLEFGGSTFCCKSGHVYYKVFTLVMFIMLGMPHKFHLVHKKSHSGDVPAETPKSRDMYTQTDIERDAVDVTT